MPSVHESGAGRPQPLLRVENLTIAHDETVIQEGLSFEVDPGDVFVIMGGSGCGKSTLLRHLIGLMKPAGGSIFYGGVDFWKMEPSDQARIRRRFGVLYQGGALWSSMTLAENVALPLSLHTGLTASGVLEAVRLKLALVGLSGFESRFPAELSGGMQKRAALARALALDPDILFCDEPSAGLDPINSCRLDQLILDLRNHLGTTVVMVTHDLASIFAVGTNSILLDAESRTAIAAGSPRRLRETTSDPRVALFLNRCGTDPARTANAS
ncbi:MAG: ABC transporter ATP-binding protein [Desulfobacterales bacterium]